LRKLYQSLTENLRILFCLWRTWICSLCRSRLGPCSAMAAGMSLCLSIISSKT